MFSYAPFCYIAVINCTKMQLFFDTCAGCTFFTNLDLKKKISAPLTFGIKYIRLDKESILFFFYDYLHHTCGISGAVWATIMTG